MDYPNWETLQMNYSRNVLKRSGTKKYNTPGLFKHVWRPVWFTLVVDNFGIKYIRKKHAEHLLTVLNKYYDMERDWDGSLYYGISLTWNYEAGYVDISMPKYVGKNLIKYKHEPPKRPQYCPYKPAPKTVGKGSNRTADEEESPEVNGEKK